MQLKIYNTSKASITSENAHGGTPVKEIHHASIRKKKISYTFK